MFRPYLLIGIIGVALSGCATSKRTVAEAPLLSAMTYNIRLNTASDGENAWPRRQDFLASQVEFHQPDVLGIQEGLPEQVDWLADRLHDYAYLGQGRRGGHRGEYSAVFYRKAHLAVVDSGTFWLSTSPERVSTGWDAALPRICTWAEFRMAETGTRFMVFNTHFDHVGGEARNQSADLILRKSEELNPRNLPIIVMGDLNLTPDTEPIQRFRRQLNDAFESAPVKLGPTGTFTGFRVDQPASRRIDYIFVSASIEVDRLATLSDLVDGRYASDHFPVMAYLNLNAGE